MMSMFAKVLSAFGSGKTVKPKGVRIKQAIGKGVLKTIAIFLLTSGANFIQNGDYIVGGLLCTVGFILLVIDGYVGG